MKNIIYYTIIILLFFTMNSCNDWLDNVKQTSTVSDDIIWDDEKTVDLYVNSFYSYLHDYGQFGDVQFGGNLTEGLTETLKYGQIGAVSNSYVVNPSTISPETCVYSIWAGGSGSAYEHIRLINQFLSLQKKYSTFSDDKNLIWEAQARFFRAFIYFQLAKRHGGVILYDDLPNVDGKARSSVDETWDFIAKDLDFAALHLPVTWNTINKSRVTKGAAYALKSRAMLYAERWQDAYDASDNIIKLNIYGLMNNYSDSWKGNNREAILEFEYDSQNGPNHIFDMRHVPGSDGYENRAPATPTQEMVEAYETKNGEKVNWEPWHNTTNEAPPYDQLEPRFHATIIYSGSTWKGKEMDCSIDGENGVFIQYRDQDIPYGKTTTGYFLRKLLDEELTDLHNIRSSQTWVEIRYAEVLLNKAEAAYRLNRLTEANNAMNEVRRRVNLPPKNSSGDLWFKDYVNERKVELSYEGHLFWDMRRWKLAHIDYNDYRVHGIKINKSSSTYEYVDCDGQDRKFIPRQYVLPVPSSELRDNPLIEQYDEWK